MIVKKSSDYIKRLHEKYPEIDEKTLRSFINYGLRSISGLLDSGNEIKLQSEGRVFLIGNPQGKQDHNKKVKRLKVRKLRRLYIKHQIEYDGYRYVSLTESKYKEFLDTGTITDCDAFKIKEEAKEHIGNNIIKIECPIEKRWKISIKKYDINDKESAEYV